MYRSYSVHSYVLGTSIAEAIIRSSRPRRVQISSRYPDALHHKLKESTRSERLLPPVAVDITKPETLAPAIRDATVVVSLVGIMHGRTEDFEQIQWRGAENVARAAQQAGAKLIHISAIGADATSHIAYARTKALGEQAVLQSCPNATIIRPSLVFGPGDGFYMVRGRIS
jgi:uncharacterized protein YbjT (DUF2867 family)